MHVRKPIRTLIIGFGMISIGYSRDPKMKKYFQVATHYDAIMENENYSLIGVVDPSDRAKLQASHVNSSMPIYKNIELVPNKEDVDLIVLATPPNQRLGIIDHFPNLHSVIVEKPIGNDLISSEEFVKSCEVRSIFLYVNISRKYDQKLLEYKNGFEKQLGNIQGIFCTYGNGLKNNGFHLIDLITMFAGKVSWVQALHVGKSGSRKSQPVDSSFPFILGLSSGVCAMVQALDYAHYREMSMEIWGEKSKILFCLEGLLSVTVAREKHRFSEGNSELAFDKPLVQITGQGIAMRNLYKVVSDNYHSGFYDGSSVSNALHVMSVIECLNGSLTRKCEKVWV